MWAQMKGHKFAMTLTGEVTDTILTWAGRQPFILYSAQIGLQKHSYDCGHFSRSNENSMVTLNHVCEKSICLKYPVSQLHSARVEATQCNDKCKGTGYMNILVQP